MIERLVVLVVLAALIVIAYRLARTWQVRRAAGVASGDPLLAARRPGVPAILYFTTPDCAPCRTRQRPALARLVADLGEDAVQVIEVNALNDARAADRWGVLSVPTTFVLDAEGRPRRVNHGVAGVETLRGQLDAL